MVSSPVRVAPPLPRRSVVVVHIEDLDRLHLDRRLAALTPLGVRLMESFSPPLASAETGRAPGEIRNVGERRDRVEGGAYRIEETT
jgi:hypothetical protein